MSAQQGHGMDAARLARIADWMASYRERQRYPGTSLLIRRHGEEAYFAADGHRSIEKDLPYERDTIVRIYSMTKVVTSVVVGMLLERGQLYLDTPVSEYIPAFKNMKALVPGATRRDQVEPAATPTLHQLLTHTSGMTYAFNPGLAAEIYAEEKVDFGPRVPSLAKMCDNAADQPLAFQPGREWQYSVGIDIIGHVLELITGKTLDVLFDEWVFAPLGMKDTFFGVPDDKIDRFADCYTITEDNPLKRLDAADNSAFLQRNVTCFSGGGGLCSTLDDYMAFGEMIRNGGLHGQERLIGARTLAFLRANHLAGDIASMGAETFSEMPMTGMGFGIGGGVVLNAACARAPGSVGDFGWGGMASTYFWTDPVEDMSVVFFTQLVPSSTYPSRAELKALVHGAMAD
ncbi:serine hydrolase domain-containing protein [Rhodalgimonas zhirmunskyi]|uniref:Beta-lactamase family protein n=1 Tax=Rhodalgimonas zhirmunskyi TaxID=2964767 RepID=A0AAJ1U4S4_9RHOB|nr:serine hydrolase domain-containing protein [Rhodoalgimonas zhirmunskyi]MDQ2093685.1 beta-lactamase family protein [Rhodoalgimonas zhirmunskyi]